MLPMHKATYRGRAIACGFGVAKTGTHQIFVTFEIVEYSDADQRWLPTGEEITWIGAFSDKTTERTIESLGHLGWTGDNLEELDNPTPDALAALMPNDVDLVCEPEEYDGKQTLKVRWVNAPGAGRFKFATPLAGPALKGFASQMRGAIRNARGASGARQAAPSGRTPAPTTTRNARNPHPNTPGTDDDVPF